MTGNPFDRTNYRALSADIAAALKPVGEKHGLTFEMSGGSIDRSGRSASLKINAAVSATGEPLPVILFKEHGASLGFKPEHLGATLTLRSRQFRLVGLMKKRDFSVLITRIPDGTEFKLPVSDALAALGVGAPVGANAGEDAARREVEGIIARMQVLYDGQGKCQEFEEARRQETALMHHLEAISDRAPEGVSVGRIIRYQVADGYAFYVITRVSGSSVSVAHVPFGDAWTSPVVRGGKLTYGHAADAVQKAAAMRNLFGKRKSG
jgi:hypothetical protein